MEDRFLTDKRIFLNNPGTQKSDLYYTRDNSEVDGTESTFYDGRYQSDLTNKSFGGAGSVNVPNQMFVGNAYLQVNLNALVADQTIGRGWLFALIDRIDYVFGGANVGNITINGQSVFQVIMAQCETSEKRSQMLRLAGEEQLTASSVLPVGQLILPLPFSGACGLDQKKPYDTSLLGSPIQINVYFKAASSIYGGTGIRPADMNKAQIILRQGELANPGQGLRPILRSIPDAMYNYPIMHHQSFVVQETSGTNQVLRFNLQQFIDADLVGIYIGIIKDSNVITTSNNTPNTFDYDDIEDFELLWNGTILYKSDRYLHELMQISQIPGSSYWENSIVASGDTAPFSSSPKNNNMIIVDLSRVREECFDGKFSNTFRIGNQTLTVTLKTDSASTSYTVYTTYVYNGMISTKSDGTSLIYFN